MHDLILEHYTAEPVQMVPRDYSQTFGHMDFMKPEGLWVSVTGEYDWPSWCRAVGVHLDRIKFRHRVHLVPDANVRLIKGGLELEAFHNEFKHQIHPAVESQGIDWQRVSGYHDGIVIAPYLWSHRLGWHLWYYGWDCASGCIWNSRAIERIDPPVEVVFREVDLEEPAD